jgi:hypothetical protein
MLPRHIFSATMLLVFLVAGMCVVQLLVRFVEELLPKSVRSPVFHWVSVIAG